MSWSEISPMLEYGANVSAIATAVIAFYAYVKFRRERAARVRRIETYLRDSKNRNAAMCQRTVIACMAECGVSEIEVMEASFSSKKITRRVKTDENGYAESVLLEYAGR